jgi:hypothetical protein
VNRRTKQLLRSSTSTENFAYSLKAMAGEQIISSSISRDVSWARIHTPPNLQAAARLLSTRENDERGELGFKTIYDKWNNKISSSSSATASSRLIKSRQASPHQSNQK